MDHNLAHVVLLDHTLEGYGSVWVMFQGFGVWLGNLPLE